MEAFEDEDAFFSGSVEALEPWRVVSSSARELLGDVTGTEDVNECFECWSRDESLRHSRARFVRVPAGLADRGPDEPVTQP